MLAKWADLSVLTGSLTSIEKIIRTYEKIGKKYLSQPLVKSSARDYFFKACLCFLANEDMPGAKKTIEKYGFEDPSFDTSKQKILLEDIVKAIEAEKKDEVDQSIAEYSKTWTVDKVSTKLLVEIKKKYCDEPQEVIGDIMDKSLNLVDGGGDVDEGTTAQAFTAGGVNANFNLT